VIEGAGGERQEREPLMPGDEKKQQEVHLDFDRNRPIGRHHSKLRLPELQRQHEHVHN